MAPVASKAHPSSATPAPFELKSASLSVVALVLRSADVAVLAQAMDAQFGGSPELFSHDPVVIDLSQLDAEAPGPDFGELLDLLRRYRMLPVAARGGTKARMEAALAAGLSEAPPAEAPAAAAPAPAPAAAAMVPEPPVAPPPPPTPAYVPTLVIHKPLRSGQQVYAKNGDLIVMAAVNFGAEVLADGNIHVYGPLRGKAVAGVKGNSEARIFTTCMEPELVSIAGTYRTTDHPLPAEVVGKPAQIRLDAGRLVFEPLP